MCLPHCQSLPMIFMLSLTEHRPTLASTMILLALVVSLSLIRVDAYFGGFRDSHRPNAPALNLLDLKEDYNSTIFNVLDFGAIGNGTGQNDEAFQNALNKAGTMKGGIVYVPPGEYVFLTSNTLHIPKGVTMMGLFGNVPIPPQFNQKPFGSVLLVKSGAGSNIGCFMQLNEETTLSGFIIYYPSQKQEQTPIQYPTTICMTGNNPVVTDVNCLNCWNAIQAVGTSRPYIARIQGQPMNTGIYIDKNSDTGTVQDVYFSPKLFNDIKMYSNNNNYLKWQLLHGRSFVFAGFNIANVLNTFSSSYAIGYHFMHSPDGGGYTNGHFIGIGSDKSANASVQVDGADEHGVLITNGQFTAYGSQNNVDSTQVVINKTNTGTVHFSNSAFWGPSDHIAKISGSGTTSFSQCVFTSWDPKKKGDAAIVVEDDASGSLLVQGCDFQYDGLGPQVELGGGNLTKAVIMGNVMRGTSRISGKAQNVQMGLNADDNINYVNLNKP